MHGRTKALVAAGLLAGGAYAVERRAVRRLRHRPAPGLDHLYDLPDDCESRELPSYDAGTLHAYVRGSGRPLVLLHGITLGGDIWAPQLHQLADHFQVVACDLRGHGRSRAGDERYGLARLARDIRTVLEVLDLHDAIVVGHSMGGMGLMHFCGDHPEVVDERVAGLGFVATAATAPLPAQSVPALRRAIDDLADRAQRGAPLRLVTMRDNDLGWLACRLAFGPGAPARAVDAVLGHVVAMDPDTLHASMADILRHDATGILPEVRVPAVVVGGTADLLTPVPLARQIAALLPDAELHLLRGSGHQVMQERPDELGEILLDLEARIERDSTHPAVG